MKKALNAAITEEVKEALDFRGYSRPCELSKEASWHPCFMSDRLNGKRVWTLNTLITFASALGLKVEVRLQVDSKTKWIRPSDAKSG